VRCAVFAGAEPGCMMRLGGTELYKMQSRVL
jgi:hypothetical protein